MLAQASLAQSMLLPMRAARVILLFLLPLAAVALLGVLSSLGALEEVDGRAWDRLLGLRPATAAPDVLIVDIDAQPGSLAGLLADGLVTLKEMRARSAVLVLPLAQKSPPSLDPSALRQTLPNALDREFAQVEENIQSLFDAIRRGSVRPRDAARYVSDLVGLVAQAKARLFSATMGIERDDDALLGQASAFFGPVYVPLDLLGAPDPSVSPALADLALQRQSLTVLVHGADPSRHVAAIRPSVLPVVRGARGGGFLADDADPDGVQRRIRLLAEHDGRHFGQIAFAAALGLLGDPPVEVSPGRIVLRGASVAGRLVTRSIPLTESGDMMLAWPPAATGDGFRHLAWSTVSAAHALEDRLVADLRDLDSRGYLTYLRSPDGLLDVYEEGSRLRRGMLASGNDSDVDSWRSIRERFFDLCDQFLNGDSEARIVADADRQLQSGELSDEEKAMVRSERNRVHPTFDEARQVLGRLQASRASLSASLRGAFCIIAEEPTERSAASPMTPFGAPASPAAASAALVSTLLSGRFPREAPPRTSLLAAVALCLLLAGAVLRLKPLWSLLVGIGAAGVTAAALGLLAAEYDLFVAPVLPSAAVLLTGIALASLKLGWKRAASRTVRAALAGRVSAESMREIGESRGRMALDGGLRTATVVCISQPWSAPVEPLADVVQRLRTHREAIAEAVLGLGGMLAEAGGRVMAYFGAPVATEDHARRACLAALRVRTMEGALNQPSSARFSSRIGIHTAECVAGLLGPAGAPVYDLAGEAPDLAGDLERLNGSFGTSILISEPVRNAAGPGFQVRVIGSLALHPPGRTRVLELISEHEPAPVPAADLIPVFEEGVARFERGEIADALRLFTRVLERLPGDGPSEAYARRCRLLLAHPGLASDSVPWGT
jgi:adenylate cyclase